MWNTNKMIISSPYFCKEWASGLGSALIPQPPPENLRQEDIHKNYTFYFISQGSLRCTWGPNNGLACVWRLFKNVLAKLGGPSVYSEDPPGPPGAPMTPGMASWAIVSHPGSEWVIFDPSGVDNSSVYTAVRPYTPPPQTQYAPRKVTKINFFWNFLYDPSSYTPYKTIWKQKKILRKFDQVLQNLPFLSK